MQDLKQYFEKHFNENLNEFRIKDVKIVFDVEPEDVIFEIPDTWNDSNIITYLGDRFGHKLPAEESIGKKLFGNNLKNINDAYFEFDSVKYLSEHENPNFKWDPHFDSSQKNPKLKYCSVYKLKYIILFDTFTLLKDDSQDEVEIANKVFSTVESSDANKYPLTLKYNSDETEFTKE